MRFLGPLTIAGVDPGDAAEVDASGVGDDDPDAASGVDPES